MLISGFLHENQRYDRDNYVKIIFENIEEEYKYQFQKREEKYSETFEKVLISKILYDYCSLMHYPEYAFAKLRYYFLIINIKLLYFPSLQNETEPTIEPLKSMKELECKYNCKKKCSNERSFWLNSWVQCSAEHRLIYELIEF